MKEKLYKEMCACLSDKEQLLNGFLSFYENNKDSVRFFELFNEEYGIIYESFGGSVKYSVSDKPNTEANLPYRNYDGHTNVNLEYHTPHTNKSNTSIDNAKTYSSDKELISEVRIIRKWVQFFGVVVIVSIALSLIGAIIVVLK